MYGMCHDYVSTTSVPCLVVFHVDMHLAYNHCDVANWIRKMHECYSNINYSFAYKNEV